ncbi:MAG TPA: helicase-related protein, partial [Solirubrobacterales bacterium]
TNAGRGERTRIVSALRHELADACIEALEPDLVILDEFQRFPRLLAADTETGRLAHKLFAYPGCKSLLLSATPYRMFSRAHELGADDHYRDFLGTVDFLLDDAERSARLRRATAEYRTALTASAGGDGRPVATARDAVRAELIRVMCRTERLGAAGDRNGMLEIAPEQALRAEVSTADLRAYADLDRLASSLQVRDVVEFWKSAPYPLNLMDNYALTRAFEDRARVGRRLPVKVRIERDAVRRYRDFDPGNARLRGLVRQMDEEGAWKCLWLPPSLPYYAPGPPFDRAGLATKRLVFSRWKVVPKAIAALTSFQMDRRIYGRLPGPVENSAEGRKSVGQPFQWRADGRLTELLPVLPGHELARLTDPLVLAERLDPRAGPAERPAVLDAAERNLRGALRRLELSGGGGAADPLWYSVALLRLDERARPGSVSAWLREEALGADDDRGAWAQHLHRLHAALTSDEGLGAVPADLASVLAHVGVGGPGPCALRALRRSFAGADAAQLGIAALRVANALRLLFNLPESVAIVRTTVSARTRRRRGEGAHWRAALNYCVNGNLQAVLDEYVHALSEWTGGADVEDRLAAVTGTAGEAIGVAAAPLRGRTIAADGTVRADRPIAFHSRIALRLDRGEGEDEQAVQRLDTVRKAFNSPFWPFVVASTSIGQEGLDFHLYSHAVVHWNLPHNPVDLEQREGRVHRFKNHAVRRNLAAAHRAEGLAAAPGDPWAAMFAAAPEQAGGLHPYWVFPGEARIERHVPFEPMSVDRHRLEELVALMGVYRLAFGQPRQEELLAALRQLGVDSALAQDLAIDLTPPARP